MKTAYVITVTKERTLLGEENPIVRIVRPEDVEEFLDLHVDDNDSAKVKVVKVYE